MAPAGRRALSLRATPAEEAEEAGNVEQIGIQSIETGLHLLGVIARLTGVGPAPMLKTIAAEAGMHPAKAHRYIVSFIRGGAVERDPGNGRYRLGPMARQMGIAALQGLDVVRVANAHLPAIRDEVQQTVALAIWAYHGPTIIAVEELRRPVMVSTRVGEVMPLLTSATGRVWGAWAAPSVIAVMLRHELAAGARGVASEGEARALFERTRADGVGTVAGGLNPVISALSAPIFDYRGTLVAALSSLGPTEEFDTRPAGALAASLRRAAGEISRELGHRPEGAR
jgi:DNA-binding IclR family transcriptional regulator